MSASAFRIHRAQSGAARTRAGATAPAGAPESLPSLTTTVPREFVHRASVAEVLLTDWARREDLRFALAAQWPRGHGFFTAVDGCHDPLIAAETIRQSGILLAHAEFGVPLDHHLLVADLDVEVRPPHIRVGLTPASLDVDVTCTEVKHRRGTLSSCRIHVRIYREGHLAATGGGFLTCIAPAVYERLRAGRLPDREVPRPLALTAPEPPQSVGRMSPMDVVLSPTGHTGRWQLRVDTRHPTLFDHPVDHVPGMVLLEAARQAAIAALGRTGLPLALTSQFLRYVELDAPCTIEAHPLPPTPSAPEKEESVRITAHQDGHPVFRSTVTLAPPTP
ncbi:ScbA/BarX family gamma-butyrolactone biosynthesis protein [Streptomyces sp. NPDC051445]|uniref:ScbA/BarX family gamma-butyrolactone biosynthesis protein n=1 Tax=Streptomyces sp. NPDC051445 TaxID=3365653 RepID=UPI0037A14432